MTIHILYLQNVVVRSKTVNQHLFQHRRMLTLSQNADVALNVEMCFLFEETFNYLFYVFLRRRLVIAETMRKEIQKCQIRTTQTAVRYIFCLCNAFRRSVQDVLRNTAQLNRNSGKTNQTCSSNSSRLEKGGG